MKKLTLRQREVLNFINEEVMHKNYPPSVREICQAMGLSSSSTVHAHLKALERKGYIKRDPAKPRAIEILEPSISFKKKQRSRFIPLLGQVTAGMPVLAEENIEHYFALPEEMVKDANNMFLLRVKGESMRDAGILQGDLVIVRQQPTAENGEIVVALIEDEATVKKFFRETAHIRLQPENPDFEPIIVTKNNLRLLGKVVGLLRIID